MGYGLLVFDTADVHGISGMEILDWVDSVAAEVREGEDCEMPQALRDFDAAITAEFPPGTLAADVTPAGDGEAARPTALAERSGEGPRYYRSPRGIFIDCPYAMVDAMDPRVRALARQYELGYFDADESRLSLPPALTERLGAERIEAAELAQVSLEERIAEAEVARALREAHMERLNHPWRGWLSRLFGGG